MTSTPSATITVLGIGADGWDGVPERLRVPVLDADVVLGGRRHLDLLPPRDGQARETWPSPLRDGLPALLERYRGRRVVAMASGDPLVSGIATTLLDLGVSVRVEPAVSSVALARGRMGWPAESHEVVSLVGRDVRRVTPYLTPGARLVVLSSDADTPATLAGLLVELGLPRTSMTVLGDLGSAAESRRTALAQAWSGTAPRLNVVALEVSRDAEPAGAWVGARGRTGLPDDAFENDGQLTRRDLRATALARLAPSPGQLLWDVGAGSGSVGIEWALTDPRCRTLAIEGDEDRVARIVRNAGRFGLPNVQVIARRAPEALAPLPRPDAIFVGGGATADGVLDGCREALLPGGRLVVHGVTLETERLLAEQYASLGGELTRIGVETAAPIGTFTGWTPARAVTQWAWTKPADAPTTGAER